METDESRWTVMRTSFCHRRPLDKRGLICGFWIPAFLLPSQNSLVPKLV